MCTSIEPFSRFSGMAWQASASIDADIGRGAQLCLEWYNPRSVQFLSRGNHRSDPLQKFRPTQPPNPHQRLPAAFLGRLVLRFIHNRFG